MEKTYPRLIEPYIEELLKELPAISIEGLKGAGKSVTASHFASTIFELDDQRDRVLLENDIDVLAQETPPVLLDEWQRVPAVWDFVRRQVDKRHSPGSYLLTGSSKNTNLDIHSGAGRILRIRMYPLSLQERGIEECTVFLTDLFSQEEAFSAKIHGNTKIGFVEYMNEIVLSGLPDIRRYSDKVRPKMLDTYITYILSHEFSQQGVRVRQPHHLLRWLSAYAAAIATDTSYNTILAAATPGEDFKPSSATTTSYREALEKFWLLEELPVWLNGEDYFARLKTSAKHYLADPAIAAYLLNFDLKSLTRKNTAITPQTVFDDKYGWITGRLFESLVHLSLRTYAMVNDAKCSFIRTRNGDHEVDFILQKGRDVVAVEVKMAAQINNEDVKHLKWFREATKDIVKDCIIIYTGPVAYRREDGIAVVPLSLLGA